MILNYAEQRSSKTRSSARYPKEEITRVNLNTIKKSDIAEWKIGQSLLLSGTILTARDAAHKKLKHLFETNESLPNGLNLKDRFPGDSRM